MKAPAQTAGANGDKTMITPAATPTAFWLDTELIDLCQLRYWVETRSTGATIHRNRQWLTELILIAEEARFYGNSEADPARVAAIVTELRKNLIN